MALSAVAMKVCAQLHVFHAQLKTLPTPALRDFIPAQPFSYEDLSFKTSLPVKKTKQKNTKTKQIPFHLLG